MENILETEASVAPGVVNVQFILAQTGPNIEVANAGVKLGRQIPILAFKEFVANFVSHSIVRTGYAEAREWHLVGDGSHPCWVVGVVGIEAEGAQVAMITRAVDEAGREREEEVEYAHDEYHGASNQ
jgi:hypothetical protein